MVILWFYGSHTVVLWYVLCMVAAFVILNNGSTMFNVISAGCPRPSDFTDFIDFFYRCLIFTLLATRTVNLCINLLNETILSTFFR